MGPLPFSISSVFRRSIYAACFSAGSLLLSSSPLLATDYTSTAAPQEAGSTTGFSAEAIGSETGTYDSNPLMRTQGATSLYGSITQPELLINDATPTSQLTSDTKIDENLFNQTNFDSTDLHQNINFQKQSALWSAGAKAQVDYDTTRTSEITTYGFNTTPVRHLGFSVAPQIAYIPDAVDQIAFLGSVITSHYDSSIYTNYEVVNVDPTYTHNFDPNNAGTFSFLVQRYKSTSGPSNTVDTAGPSIGWIASLTPDLTAKAAGGIQTMREYQTNVPSQPYTLDYVYSGDLSYKTIQDKTDLLATRNEYPFGNGTEALLSTYSLTEVHALNALFSLNAAGSYQSANYQTNTIGNLKSLYTLRGGVSYHITDKVDLTTSYQYRYENLTDTSANAHDNMITVGIVYHPEAWDL